mmetsp:Transcript_6269/g.15783  ORF Transcript_6269/g.15783 Transcript_6269/m.15783 type:complete len:297 (+) Transcript_6269:449-1339(+)
MCFSFGDIPSSSDVPSAVVFFLRSLILRKRAQYSSFGSGPFGSTVGARGSALSILGFFDQSLIKSQNTMSSALGDMVTPVVDSLLGLVQVCSFSRRSSGSGVLNDKVRSLNIRLESVWSAPAIKKHLFSDTHGTLSDHLTTGTTRRTSCAATVWPSLTSPRQHLKSNGTRSIGCCGSASINLDDIADSGVCHLRPVSAPSSSRGFGCLLAPTPLGSSADHRHGTMYRLQPSCAATRAKCARLSSLSHILSTFRWSRALGDMVAISPRARMAVCDWSLNGHVPWHPNDVEPRRTAAG